MGATSIILQILCLRQLLSTFSGNELIIGITLAVWLIAVSIGSFAGSRLALKNAFALSFLLIAVIAQPTIMLIDAIRPITGLELGEVIPLSTTIMWTVIALAGLCISIGLQFPLAVAYLRDKAPEVYSFEAAGAFTGGALFTFLFAGRIDTYTLALITALVSVIVSAYIMKKKALLFLAILPIIYYYGSFNILPSLKYKEVEFVKRVESRYGEIEVLKLKDQLNVYSSEKFQYSYPDNQSEEQSVHLPMSIHPAAEEILVVGGSPAAVREFLKYPVSRIDFVEIDPVMIAVSKGLISPDDREYFNDNRVNTLNIDARRYIKSSPPSKYDLIVLNISAPSTANINRYYTREFFDESKAVLKDDGILYLSLPVSFGYIGRRMQMANGSIYRSLKGVFPHVDVSSEEYGILAASVSPLETDPNTLSSRFSDRKIETEYFRSYILKDAFSPLQVNMVKGRLGQIRELNSDKRPVSYLYNLMLWSEIHGGKGLNILLGLDEYEIFILVGIILILITFLFVRKKGTVPYVLFTTGYITMAFSLIIILAYQAYSGYIYEMIGLLTGTFMLGGAAGAYIARNTRGPVRWLTIFDLFIIALMVLAILFMEREIIFYFFIFTAGLLGGGQFATANILAKAEGKERCAGKLYAVDLAGSFLGSFLTAIFMVPLTGIRNTILFLIFMKAVSLALLIRYRKA